MRRILSILLALVLGLGSGAAVLPADALTSAVASGWTGKVDESRLPACCRRNGKHHCTMNSESADGPAAVADREIGVSAQESCPFLPHTMDSTAPPVADLAQNVANSLALHAQLRAKHGIVSAAPMSDRRSCPKRGPPATQIL
jgi:hypothetical protein